MGSLLPLLPLVLVVSTALAGEPGPLDPADLAEYRIAFTSERSGTDEVWVINADGSGLTQLTDNGSSWQGDSDPDWSPNGKRIAFNTYRFGGWKVGVMEADGSGVRRLTHNDRSVYEGSPAWSPDGRRVAFMRYRSKGGIWICDADGGNALWVLDNGSEYYESAQPAWSFDGARLLYVSRSDGDYEIWSMKADGSERRRITENESDDLAPAMSRDGARILFYSNRDGAYETYVMNADGSHPIRLTFHGQNPAALEEGPSGADALNPAWSPDGRMIAFVEHHDGQRDIFLARPDGTERRRLTKDPAHDYFPAWILRRPDERTDRAE